MLNIIHYAIAMEKSRPVYAKPFSAETLKEEWVIKSGEWYVKDDTLIGKSAPDAGGMIFSKAEYKHDIVMEFTASNEKPSTHDLDFMWHAIWDEEQKQRGSAYVVGINGWWENKVGFEKAPDNVLYAATDLFTVNPEEYYKIHAGTIKGICFLFINGRLIIEMRDPDPIDYNKSPFVGFETFQSIIKVKDLKIYEPYVLKRNLSYKEEY